MVKTPLAYRLFFLHIEPVATFAGAVVAFFSQNWYYHGSDPTLATAPVSAREQIVANQLANMYMVFALNEALVLRATSSRRIWSVLLFGLLLADLGHLYSVHPAGPDVYWRFWDWNSLYWGHIGFVYAGASLRVAYLLGVGL
ncbi:hypothetical protein K470DRAFT_222420 [Piedraia hortae CBS 480.64]|uniref:DUF7704 domain-containing protein n=1 Tax=Piedraia hortae CBS 480.64 TaxID=1314780 RepID=A0A6A7BT60_9PEZI|nr:hypothetical protein K470DRAFT_222420 [Piedraia hortae CBS 480.64]